MKKFVIETNQNYVEVMRKILSDCDVSGNLQPEIRSYLETLKNKDKPYNCSVLNNILRIEMKMPFRNSFASTMNLEILTSGNKTRINGSIASILSGGIFRKVFAVFILIGSFLLLFVTIRNSYGNFQPVNYACIIGFTILFLSALTILFKEKKGKKREASEDPYGVQIEHWISNLFPGEFRLLDE